MWNKDILDRVLVCVSWTATPSWLYLSDHRIQFHHNLQWTWRKIASSIVPRAGAQRSLSPRRAIDIERDLIAAESPTLRQPDHSADHDGQQRAVNTIFVITPTWVPVPALLLIGRMTTAHWTSISTSVKWEWYLPCVVDPRGECLEVPGTESPLTKNSCHYSSYCCYFSTLSLVFIYFV